MKFIILADVERYFNDVIFMKQFKPAKPHHTIRKDDMIKSQSDHKPRTTSLFGNDEPLTKAGRDPNSYHNGREH